VEATSAEQVTILTIPDGFNLPFLNGVDKNQCYHVQELIFPSKTLGVFWNLFEFSVAEITLKSTSPTF
jgi:hypothetical protein